jgi:hypothetical protein
MTYERFKLCTGRTVVQAVSRWLPTTASRVRARLWSSEICGGQSGAGAGYSEYFGFPCQSLFDQARGSVVG